MQEQGQFHFQEREGFTTLVLPRHTTYVNGYELEVALEDVFTGLDIPHELLLNPRFGNSFEPQFIAAQLKKIHSLERVKDRDKLHDIRRIYYPLSQEGDPWLAVPQGIKWTDVKLLQHFLTSQYQVYTLAKFAQLATHQEYGSTVVGISIDYDHTAYTTLPALMNSPESQKELVGQILLPEYISLVNGVYVGHVHTSSALQHFLPEHEISETSDLGMRIQLPEYTRQQVTKLENGDRRYRLCSNANSNEPFIEWLGTVEGPMIEAQLTLPPVY